MTRKNYSEYKDGLPVINLTASKIRLITEKHFCVKATAHIDGKRIKVRIRLKPKRKMTAAQELVMLRKELRKLKQQVAVGV